MQRVCDDCDALAEVVTMPAGASPASDASTSPCSCTWKWQCPQCQQAFTDWPGGLLESAIGLAVSNTPLLNVGTQATQMLLGGALRDARTPDSPR